MLPADGASDEGQGAGSQQHKGRAGTCNQRRGRRSQVAALPGSHSRQSYFTYLRDIHQEEKPDFCKWMNLQELALGESGNNRSIRLV